MGGEEGGCGGSTNMPAMHHFIINSHVGVKSPTLSDLTDGWVCKLHSVLCVLDAHCSTMRSCLSLFRGGGEVIAAHTGINIWKCVCMCVPWQGFLSRAHQEERPVSRREGHCYSPLNTHQCITSELSDLRCHGNVEHTPKQQQTQLTARL